MRARLILVMSLAVALVSGDAHAATVSVETIPQSRSYIRHMTVTAAPGETNRIRVTRVNEGWSITDESAPITAGAGCSGGGSQAVCSVPPNEAGSTDATVDLGDGDDVFFGTHPYITVSDGPGADRVTTDGVMRAGPGPDVFREAGGEGGLYDFYGGTVDYAGRDRGVTVTPDGVANDGEPGEADDVLVRNVYGTDHADRLTAPSYGLLPPFSHELHGGRGDDVLIGGPSRDDLFPGPGTNRADAGAGDDRVSIEVGSTGDYKGGAGGDLVLASDGDDSQPLDQFGPATLALDDSGNKVDRGVLVTGFESASVRRGWVVGSAGNDHLIAEVGAVDGGAGNDVIGTAGSVTGGPGQDDITIGVEFGYPNLVFGPSAVDSRDGEVDTIRCGWRVAQPFIADANDRTTDCLAAVGFATRARGFRPDSSGSIAVRVVCERPADLACSGTVRVVQRGAKKGKKPGEYGTASFDRIAPGAKATVKIPLASGPRKALAKGRELRGTVVAVTNATNPDRSRTSYPGYVVLKPPRR